ncbi:MAG: hypothetical protein BWY63_03347 [Chloroflexi bacterium ADurb.Bin360]|nr:MAG: hypothetical protein BWY63_03347 [Chloroflexi bacterium ADurb.Bin360]
MALGKVFDMDGFAVLLCRSIPFQRLNAHIGLRPITFIDQAIAFERAIVQFAQALNPQHQFPFGIPGIHQHRPKRQLLVMDHVQHHLPHMIQFAFSVAVGIVDAVINNPELIQFRIHIHAGHNPDPTDDPMFVAAILLAHQFNLTGVLLIQHGIIKDHIALRRSDHLRLHILPYQTRCDFVPFQIPLGPIMAEFFGVVRKIRQRVIDLAYQQKLTVIQACYFAHALHYSAICRVA